MCYSNCPNLPHYSHARQYWKTDCGRSSKNRRMVGSLPKRWGFSMSYLRKQKLGNCRLFGTTCCAKRRGNTQLRRDSLSENYAHIEPMWIYQANKCGSYGRDFFLPCSTGANIGYIDYASDFGKFSDQSRFASRG